MALKSKQPTFADDEVVVCHTSFAIYDDTVVQGERRRGSNATVKAYPGNFVPDGTPPSEWPHLWAGVPVPPEHVPEFHRVAEPIPDEQCAVAQVAFSVGTRTFAKGERIRWDDPIVQRSRELFLMAPLPVPEAGRG